MRQIKSLFHVNFPTNHWDEMVNFYTNVCGFDYCFTVTEADMKRMFGEPVEPGDEDIKNGCYIRVSADSYIEIMDKNKEGLTIKEDPYTAYHHIALLTDNLRRVAQDFAEKGYPLIHNPLDRTPISLNPWNPYLGEDGCYIAWVIDPDGHAIEILQETDKSTQKIFEEEHPIED